MTTGRSGSPGTVPNMRARCRAAETHKAKASTAQQARQITRARQAAAGRFFSPLRARMRGGSRFVDFC